MTITYKIISSDGHKVHTKGAKEKHKPGNFFVFICDFSSCPSWLKHNLIQFLFILLFTSFSEFPLVCQEKQLSETIINIAEDLASDETDPEAVSVFIERLEELAENPVRINSEDENEIPRLFFLSDFQIITLRNHVKSSGEIVSAFEIATIPGFDRALTEIMLPFINISPGADPAPDSVILRNTLQVNLMTRPGETDTSCLGNQWKVLIKYKAGAGRFSGGFTMEKDPGEKLIYGSFPQPDFLSGYLSYSGRGTIKKIVAGDFSARFGQGTNINTGMRSRMPLTATGYLSGRDEIRSYTSTDENNFFRGIAGTFSLKNFEFSMLFSRKSVDATIVMSDDSTLRFAENLYSSGLHNTQSSMLKKDAIISTDYGTGLTLNLKSVRAGMVWSATRFNVPFGKSSPNPLDLFRFSGMRNSVYTIYYSSQFGRFLMYGEISSNDLRNNALIQGITLRPSDRLTLNVLFRSYSPGFATFHGKGPGYGTATGNEYGLTGNFTFEAAKHLFIMAGSEICYFPWLKYRSSSPSLAKRYEVRFNYAPSDNFSSDFTYSFRFNMLEGNSEYGIPRASENTIQSFKGTIKYSPNTNLILSARIDYRITEPGTGRGMMLLQDVNYRFRKFPLRLWLRYCIYNTTDWNSRVYAYENDLLYSFSIPAFSGRGSRSYLMSEWEIGDFAELRIKYGITSTLINGLLYEERDEIKLQLRVRF